jgi:uncharacterized phage protein (TIGR01671 family)
MSKELKYRDYDPIKKKMRYFRLDEYDKEEHNSYGNIMECIGLNDKNHLEIYENDNVKCRDLRDLTEFQGTVEFDNASFYIKSDVCSHYRWMDYEVEVMGNIHETK